MDNVMLTTKDNPFDPFTEYGAWYTWDLAHGYNTCGWLAKLAYTSPDLPDEANEIEIDNAMKRMVEIDPLQMHTIVTGSNDTGRSEL